MMTIIYFSIYAIIFLVASFISAISVRKELKQHKMMQTQLEINIHSIPSTTNESKDAKKLEIQNDSTIDDMDIQTQDGIDQITSDNNTTTYNTQIDEYHIKSHDIDEKMPQNTVHTTTINHKEESKETEEVHTQNNMKAIDDIDQKMPQNVIEITSVKDNKTMDDIKTHDESKEEKHFNIEDNNKTINDTTITDHDESEEEKHSNIHHLDIDDKSSDDNDKEQLTQKMEPIQQIKVKSYPNGKADWKWYTPIQKWYKSIQKKRKIYISLLPHIFDQATDFGVIFEYYYMWRLGDDSPVNTQINTLYLFSLSIFVLIIHRIISGYAVLRLTHKWFDVLLQMFDLLMVKCIWINYQLDIDEPSNSQRYLQVLEATFESSPQLLIAMGFLAKNGVSNASPIIIVSTIASLFSLTSRIATDDKAMFSEKMKNLNFKFKALFSLDLFETVNFWYILRVFLWRLVEMTSRIFLCTLIWINLGGFALFCILIAEFVYITCVSIKLKTIDTMGLMVYITFVTGSVNRKKNKITCSGKHRLVFVSDVQDECALCNNECNEKYGCSKCHYYVCMQCFWNEEPEEEQPLFEFEFNNIKIYRNELYLLIFGVYRIISSFLYLILVTIFATTKFEAEKVPEYADRHDDTINEHFVLFMLIYTWIGSCFWPLSMCISGVANDGLRSNARDIAQLIKSGYILELMQLIEFGSEYPFEELSHIFTVEQRIVIARRLLTNPDPKTWETVHSLLQHLDLNKAMINAQIEKQFDNSIIMMVRDIQQSATIYGGTLLHHAVKYSSYDNVRYLITKGADIDILCVDEHSVYYYAKFDRFYDLKQQKDTLKIITLVDSNMERKPNDYNWKSDRETALNERNKQKKSYLAETREIQHHIFELESSKTEYDKTLKLIEEILNKIDISIIDESVFQKRQVEIITVKNFWKFRRQRQIQQDDEKEEKNIDAPMDIKAKDITVKQIWKDIRIQPNDEIQQILNSKIENEVKLAANKAQNKAYKIQLKTVQQNLHDIAGKEREEQEAKAKDMILHAARQTLPAAPLLLCLVLLPIAFIIISVIASIMATVFLSDNDVYKLECVAGSDLRINSINITGYRFECGVLLIVSFIECFIMLVAFCAVPIAVKNGFSSFMNHFSQTEWMAFITCNAGVIMVELIIMFHLYHVWNTAECSNTQKMKYSLSSLTTIYRLWIGIAVILIVFVIWLYSYFRRLILNYIKNDKQSDTTIKTEMQLFMMSEITDTSMVGPCCCSLYMMLLWVLITLIVMIMSAAMILEFNENCYRFNGSAKIEVSVLFIICCLSLSMPLRIVAHFIYVQQSNETFTKGEHFVQTMIQSPLSIFSKTQPKIAEFCIVFFSQIVLMFHSFLYWNDVDALDNDDCNDDTYFTAEEVSDLSLVWIIISVIIVLFMYLFIRAINSIRDSVIKQTTDKIERTEDDEDINRGHLGLFLFHAGQYGTNHDRTELKAIEHGDISSPNTLCSVILTNFIFVVWSLFSIIISLVSSLIAFNIGNDDCKSISSSKMRNYLSINGIFDINGFGLMIECIILCSLTILSLRLLYFFIQYSFDHYDYHQPQTIPKALLYQQQCSKGFMFIFLVVTALQTLIMIHLYIYFHYIVECGYYFNFQISKAILMWFIFGILTILFFLRTYALLNNLHKIHNENKEKMKNVFNKLKTERVKGAQDCPGNHGLEGNESDSEMWCSVCFTLHPGGATMYGCGDCDYYECAKCYHDAHEIKEIDEVEHNDEEDIDDEDKIQRYGKIEAYSSVPVFCCLYMLWFVSCIALALGAIKFVYDDDITDLYSQCNNDLLINQVNVGGYRAEAILFLIISILPCCIPCICIVNSEIGKSNVNITMSGCCTICIQFSIIIHLYFAFKSFGANCNHTDTVSISPKVLSKVCSALISFFIFMILLMASFYYGIRNNIFAKFSEYNEYRIYLFKDLGTLSVIVSCVLTLIFCLTLTTLTLIIGFMALIMSLSSNIQQCGDHDSFGRVIGFCVFAVSLTIFMISITIIIKSRHLFHIFNNIRSIISRLSTFLGIMMLQFIVIYHQFIYWNNLSITDCNPMYVTVKDIRNASATWLIAYVIALFCFVVFIRIITDIRNSMIEKCLKEIREFNENKSYCFIEGLKLNLHPMIPPQIFSWPLIYAKLASICLFISWISLTSIICVIGSLTSLHKYISLMTVDVDIWYLSIEFGLLIIIAALSCYISCKKFKLIYYEFDCDESAAKLLLTNSKLTVGFYTIYIVQCGIMLHLAFVFYDKVKSDTLNRNKIDILYLIIAWFCNTIILVIVYRLILFKRLNTLVFEAIDWSKRLESKLSTIFSEIRNIESKNELSKPTRIKNKKIDKKYDDDDDVTYFGDENTVMSQLRNFKRRDRKNYGDILFKDKEERMENIEERKEK